MIWVIPLDLDWAEQTQTHTHTHITYDPTTSISLVGFSPNHFLQFNEHLIALLFFLNSKYIPISLELFISLKIRMTSQHIQSSHLHFFSLSFVSPFSKFIEQKRLKRVYVANKFSFEMETNLILPLKPTHRAVYSWFWSDFIVPCAVNWSLEIAHAIIIIYRCRNMETVQIRIGLFIKQVLWNVEIERQCEL